MKASQQPRCSSCRYWSDQVARADADGRLRAMCLSQRSYQSGTYTPPMSWCAAHQRGEAVDTPNSERSAA